MLQKMSNDRPSEARCHGLGAQRDNDARTTIFDQVRRGNVHTMSTRMGKLLSIPPVSLQIC